MKAARLYGPYDVRIEQVAKPSAPGPGEILMQVILGGVCGTDAHQFCHATRRVQQEGPVILGHEILGQVTAVGRDVEHLHVGERCIPGAGWWCGVCPSCQEGRTNICDHYHLYGIQKDGGFAEYATFPAHMCVRVPSQCSNEAAVLAQPLAVARHALTRANIKPEHTVALVGVGGIGSLLLAILSVQATPLPSLIAIDHDPVRLATAASLGATVQVDINSIDPIRAVHQQTQGRGVDVVIEASGVPEAIALAYALVRKGGTILQVGIPSQPVQLALDHLVTSEISLLTTNGHVCATDLPAALELLATTDLARRVGYDIIPLDMLVAEGLLPLVEHRAHRKMLVSIQAPTTNLKQDAHERTAL